MDFARELEDLITTVVRENASDLHFSVGRYPTLRVNGALIPLTKKQVLTPEVVQGIVFTMLEPAKQEEFIKNKELDFSFDHKGRARFRVNIFYQRCFVCCAMRLVAVKIRTVE